MKHYINITILPDGDISIAFLWEKLFEAVHHLLVVTKDGPGKGAIATAFPENAYPPASGDTIC